MKNIPNEKMLNALNDAVRAGMASLEQDGFKTLHDEERFVMISDLFMGLLSTQEFRRSNQNN